MQDISPQIKGIGSSLRNIKEQDKQILSDFGLKRMPRNPLELMSLVASENTKFAEKVSERHQQTIMGLGAFFIAFFLIYAYKNCGGGSSSFWFGKNPFRKKNKKK